MKQLLKQSERPFRIKELFCYIHPLKGIVVRKSYANITFFQKENQSVKAAIKECKRKLEKYNTRVTSKGDKPITICWWEESHE